MARRPTVIMFHGNAGSLGHRIPLGMVFQMHMRCNVLMVSYRGYAVHATVPKTNAHHGLDTGARKARRRRKVSR
jgi:hypothetical protein